MIGRCQDPRCKFKRREDILYLHSSKLYNKKLWKDTKEPYYKACNECVSFDHAKWDEKHK